MRALEVCRPAVREYTVLDNTNKAIVCFPASSLLWKEGGGAGGAQRGVALR